MNSNIVAQKKINSMYANSTGASAQHKTIMIITAISFLFGLISIIGSAVGFNYDFIILMPEYSVFTAIVLAIALESARLAAIMGFFSFVQFELKAIFGSLMIILTVLAIVLHFRGMESMAIVKTNQSIKEVMNHNQQMELMQQNRADTLLSSSIKAQEAVLNNGTKYDDKLMVQTMSKNTQLIAELSASKRISPIQAKYLMEQKKQAKTLQSVFSIILPIIEIFALFGFFAAFLKTKAVSTGVKEVVQTHHTLSALEATKNLYVDTPIVGVEKQATDNIKAKLLSDYSTRNGVNFDQKNDPKLNGSQSTETSHTVDSSDDQKSTENLKNNINFEDRQNEEQEEGAKSFKEQAKEKEEQLFTIDLMMFPVGYNEVIKAMFDNGTLGKHDFLVPKESVVKKLGITRAYYETVAYDLVKNKHIVSIKGKGYLALSDLKNEVKVAYRGGHKT